MPKWAFAAVGTAAIALLVALTHALTRFSDYRKIEAAQSDAQELRARYDSIYAAVHLRDSMARVIEERVAELLRASGQLRDEVAALERRRRADRLAVHMIDNSDALQARFADKFPEYATTFRRTELRDEPTGVSIEYGMLPVMTFGAFVNYRGDAESLKLQRDSLFKLDTLRVQTIQRQDSVVALERASRFALQQGYDTTFHRYVRLNDAYVAHLREPRFRIAVPKWQMLLATAVGGVVLGTQVR